MTTTYVDNILSVFERATDAEYAHGMTWYNLANKHAWELDFRDFRNGAGVLAALSPLLSWPKNVEYARLAYSLKGYPVEDVVNYIPTLRGSARKALAIVNGADPRNVISGPKVTSFFTNIVDPYCEDPRFVTIDKHAMDIANGEVTPYKGANKINAKGYVAYANAYVAAAREMGILPLQMQAVTWVAWRNMKGEGE